MALLCSLSKICFLPFSSGGNPLILPTPFSAGTYSFRSVLSQGANLESTLLLSHWPVQNVVIFLTVLFKTFQWSISWVFFSENILCWILQDPIGDKSTFYPMPVLASEYCCCQRLCVNHLLVRTITQDPFKLGSPNLDERRKIPWLRSLLFRGGGGLALTFKVKFNLKFPVSPLPEIHNHHKVMCT